MCVVATEVRRLHTEGAKQGPEKSEKEQGVDCREAAGAQKVKGMQLAAGRYRFNGNAQRAEPAGRRRCEFNAKLLGTGEPLVEEPDYGAG
jgi:hypothetical protein